MGLATLSSQILPVRVSDVIRNDTISVYKFTLIGQNIVTLSSQVHGVIRVITISDL
jgi:hypothetical protein